MKEKALIYATGNEIIRGEYNVSYYIFEKDIGFLNWLGKLLEDVLEIKGGRKMAMFIVKEKYDENDNPIGSEIYAKDIKKMADLHEHFENKGERVDVFYGKERVYLTFRKSRDARKKFADFVLKTRDWVEVREISKMPVYASERRN